LAGNKNFYDILGLPRDASEDLIKKTFRRLAHKHHPDKNPGAGAVALFKEISLAYKTLSNPSTRRQYDLTLTDVRPRKGPARASTHNAPAATARGEPGKNLVYHISISLEEGFSGTEKTVRYVRTVNGTRQTSSVDVTIPPGIRDEKKLRVRGAGESLSPQQTPGDLVVVVHLLPHPFYAMDESDIILTLPISPLDLLPLGQITVPSLHGPLTAAGVELDEFQHPTLNFKGRGYPVAENSRKYGDLFVRFVIDVPPSIDENLKNKLRELKQSMPRTARQKELDRFLRS